MVAINSCCLATLSIEGTTHLLHRLGFVYKKTTIVPGKVNPGLQKCFRELYLLIKKMKEPEDRIYFLDATHSAHNNMPCYGWIYKGGHCCINGSRAESGCTRSTD